MAASNNLLKGRYEIRRKVKAGGMGEIYEAYDLLKRNTVAVKRTFTVAGLHADLFFREASLLAQLDHPGLPKVDDFFSDHDDLFLVMEFIEGDDLLKLLTQQGKPLAPEVVVKWADELFDALIYLHTRKPQIIHRDIKPENIKLARSLKIKLLDFGLAKNIGTKIEPNSIIGGTEGYASPEQFIKGDTVDPRADIYALGATLYHLLTGVIPTKASTRLECVRFQVPDPVHPVHEINPEVPVAVSAVIAKAMTLDRNLRYQTAADMRQALRDASQVVIASDPLPSTIIDPPFDSLSPKLGNEPVPVIKPASLLPGVVQHEPEFPPQQQFDISPASREASRVVIAPAPLPSTIIDPLVGPPSLKQENEPVLPIKPASPPPDVAQRESESPPQQQPDITPPLQIAQPVIPAVKTLNRTLKFWLAAGVLIVMVTLAVLIRQGKLSGKSDLIRQPNTVSTNQLAPVSTSPPTSIPGINLPGLQTFTFETARLDAEGTIIDRSTKTAQSFTEDLGNGVKLEMVMVPGGTLTMGLRKYQAKYEVTKRYRISSQDLLMDNTPRRQVTVWPFAIGKYEVTQEQWRAVTALPKVERDLKPAPSEFKGDSLPVERVSWYDAVEFCKRLSKKTGRTYRLPSEAEWEYAARAGTTTPFAFGETITPEVVNYGGKSFYPYASAPKGVYREKTVPVGSLGLANVFGLFDMHGNVWEWCQDVWHYSYDEDNPPTDGSAWTAGGEQDERVLRGGSWLLEGELCGSDFRNRSAPGARYDDVGFRVVVSSRTQ